jgi:hypothetical protein
VSLGTPRLNPPYREPYREPRSRQQPVAPICCAPSAPGLAPRLAAFMVFDFTGGRSCSALPDHPRSRRPTRPGFGSPWALCYRMVLDAGRPRIGCSGRARSGSQPDGAPGPLLRLGQGFKGGTASGASPFKPCAPYWVPPIAGGPCKTDGDAQCLLRCTARTALRSMRRFTARGTLTLTRALALPCLP